MHRTSVMDGHMSSKAFQVSPKDVFWAELTKETLKERSFTRLGDDFC